MIRIATLYESGLGRNDGNPLYVTSFLKRVQYYHNLMTGRGINQELLKFFPTKELDPSAESYAKEWLEKYKEPIEIEHIAPNPDADYKKFGTFDLWIDTDWGEDGLTGILPYKPFETPHPCAVWNSDTHLGYDYRMNKSKKADFVFCAQKQAVSDMKRDGILNPIWLPHAVEPLAYPKVDFASKKYDVCFVGHVNADNRIEAMDRLFKEFPNFFYGQRLFEQAAEIYASSKIVFNISMKNDTNMRCFEALAAGSFLLTDWVPDIEELFEDGKHLVLYRSLDEMVDKAKYYLAHDDERQSIAEAGYQHVMNNHTIGHRVDRILTEFLNSRKETVCA